MAVASSRFNDVFDIHFFVILSKNWVASSQRTHSLMAWSMPWYAVVSHSIHSLDVLLANAVVPSHGATHALLRKIVPGLHSSGTVHSTVSSMPHMLISFLYWHEPLGNSLVSMVSVVYQESPSFQMPLTSLFGLQHQNLREWFLVVRVSWWSYLYTLEYAITFLPAQES